MRDKVADLQDKITVAALSVARGGLYAIWGIYVACVMLVFFVPVLLYFIVLKFNRLFFKARGMFSYLTFKTGDGLDWFDAKQLSIADFNTNIKRHGNVWLGAMRQKQADIKRRLADRWRHL